MGEVIKMKGSYITPCTITPQKAAELAGCSLSHIYHNMGQFIRRRTGKTTKINEESLMVWINSKTKDGGIDLDAESDRILAGIGRRA
jgi:hypothetical protein